MTLLTDHKALYQKIEEQAQRAMASASRDGDGFWYVIDEGEKVHLKGDRITDLSFFQGLVETSLRLRNHV